MEIKQTAHNNIVRSLFGRVTEHEQTTVIAMCEELQLRLVLKRQDLVLARQFDAVWLLQLIQFVQERMYTFVGSVSVDMLASGQRTRGASQQSGFAVNGFTRHRRSIAHSRRRHQQQQLSVSYTRMKATSYDQRHRNQKRTRTHARLFAQRHNTTISSIGNRSHMMNTDHTLHLCAVTYLWPLMNIAFFSSSCTFGSRAAIRRFARFFFGSDAEYNISIDKHTKQAALHRASRSCNSHNKSFINGGVCPAV